MSWFQHISIEGYRRLYSDGWSSMKIAVLVEGATESVYLFATKLLISLILYFYDCNSAIICAGVNGFKPLMF